MPENNGVVTVVINGYLWVYTLTEEQTKKMMAPLEDNISHFTRISPGKDHTVFGCAMCKCRNVPDALEAAQAEIEQLTADRNAAEKLVERKCETCDWEAEGERYCIEPCPHCDICCKPNMAGGAYVSGSEWKMKSQDAVNAQGKQRNGCSCASPTDEWHGWECSITDGACMFFLPDAKRCAEVYGEGPLAENATTGEESEEHHAE